MAQLHRFVALRDRHDTCVFTFLLSRRVTKPLSPDIFTRDFACAHQRWCLSFVRREKHLSVYLVLKEAADGLQVALDYSITILNREHFSRNEGFNVRACVFSRERDTHGRKMFVSIDDLLGRQFTDGNSEYVIELTIGGALTTFTHRLRMPDLTRATGFPKYETTYFSFGSYDWSVSMFPHGDSDDNVGRPLVYLTRHTHFEHLCKLKYELTLGEGAACMDSDTIQHVFDISGTGEGYVLNNVSVASLLRQAELYVALKLLSVGTVSEVRIPVLDRGRNCATLYDRDKQAWAVVSEFDRGTLKLRLFYSDARNVPRNYLRYVAWNAVVVTATGDTVPVSDGPFYRYYVQVECDDGYDMTTNIQENDLKADGPYLDADEKLTVHIEWKESHLLLQSNYSKYDDITLKHDYQMKKEVEALQSENYSLEKQLHSYQQSIAVAHGKAAGPPNDVGTHANSVGSD